MVILSSCAAHSGEANNGDMVAVWLDDRDETTLKYFYQEGNRVACSLPTRPWLPFISTIPYLRVMEAQW